MPVAADADDTGYGGATISSGIDSAGGPRRPRILCVDDDPAIGATVRAILEDEGYHVSYLPEITDGALRRAIEEVKPDCILLDSDSATSYHHSWRAAARIRRRAGAVPVIMFSAHLQDTREAQENTSARSRAAGFAAVLPKPFTIDQLLAAVATAMRATVEGSTGSAKPA